MQKQQLEHDNSQLAKEKAEILEQLQNTTRQKNLLAEDLIVSKKDNERLNAYNSKLTKEKEELNKERNNLLVDITSFERDNQTQSEVNVLIFHNLDLLIKIFYKLADCCLES